MSAAAPPEAPWPAACRWQHSTTSSSAPWTFFATCVFDCAMPTGGAPVARGTNKPQNDRLAGRGRYGHAACLQPTERTSVHLCLMTRAPRARRARRAPSSFFFPHVHAQAEIVIAQFEGASWRSDDMFALLEDGRGAHLSHTCQHSSRTRAAHREQCVHRRAHAGGRRTRYVAASRTARITPRRLADSL